MATKCVKVCRNGDGFFPPVNVVVNPRDIRNMDAFLDRVTQATRMRHAVRRVCTPRKGHKIEDLTKLVSGQTYVAVGQEGFKTLEYSNIQLQKPVLQRREIKIEPVKHSRILMSARCKKVALWESAGLKTIYVYRNGDDKHPSHKILLDRRILLSMDKVLEHVTERVKLESGAVFGLYTLHGKEVNNTSEIASGEKYVAVGHGKRFKRTAYNDNQKVSPKNSPRRAKIKYKIIARKKTSLSTVSAEMKKGKVFVEKGSGNEVQGKMTVPKVPEPARIVQLVPNYTRLRKEETDDPTQQNRHEGRRDETKKEKPADEHQDAKPLDDIYKASGADSEKAKQVDDDQDIHVEKPVDHIPAEEVVEEIEEQNQSENTERAQESQDQSFSERQDTTAEDYKESELDVDISHEISSLESKGSEAYVDRPGTYIMNHPKEPVTKISNESSKSDRIHEEP